MFNRIEPIWYVGYSNDLLQVPLKSVPSHVPGAVQLDYARAEEWPEYTYGDNYKDYKWMEDMFWKYFSILELHEIKNDECVFLVSKGIDYKFEILLDGKVIHKQEGMFTPFEIDITEIASTGSRLEIILHPAPKREGAPVGRAEADDSCKPAVSYGWDWHPRLIPLGIWDDTYIEIRPSVHIKNMELSYLLKDDLNIAELSHKVLLSKPLSGFIKWALYDKDGAQVSEIINENNSKDLLVNYSLHNPNLWWPNGQGTPYLYEASVELYDSFGKLIEKQSTKVGFRTVKLTMHPGAWEYPKPFPKGRSNPPITMEINGRQIFCKGSNWVNPEIFPGIINKDTYLQLLELAKEANMNMLRSWGGGIINKDCFFELCDELGLMVWQEFPLACNNYKGTEHYLEVLDQESRSIIKRLRHHACLVMWCGGNELFNAWSGMTDQSLALRLLSKNCYELDINTPFIMTSPLMGMAHGNYLFRYDTGEDVFQVMPKADNTAYTEFGCPGPSSVEYLKTFIPANQLFPPKPGTVWEDHHAFNAWTSDTWLCLNDIEHYFGEITSLEKLVEYGQLLQSEGYKSIFEEARRQKPRCSMALNWCYSEPWPSAANNSIINWPAKPKPSYYAVQASCRSVLASARIPKFSWKEGEVFNPEIWILNDSPENESCGRIEVLLKINEEEIPLLEWNFPELEQNTNLIGPVIRYVLPKKQAMLMHLVIKVKDKPEWNSSYTLRYIENAEQVNKSETRRLNY